MGAVWITYLLIGAVVALNTPQRVFAMGQDCCFDELCFAVIGVDRLSAESKAIRRIAANHVLYVVKIRETSHSLGRPQREGGATATLVDAGGGIHQPVPSATFFMDGPRRENLPLYAAVPPGESLFHLLVFDVPSNVVRPGIVIGHSYKLNPASVIIGDDSHFLHKHAVTWLDK